jgi:peptidoglycan/LPS O-acetylase OafA/YrhL
MLTPKERRFIRSWEEQRKGGKRSYFLLYIIAGTIVTSIGVAFVQSMLRFGLPERLWTIPVISFLVTAGLTWYSWKNNEKRFRELIKRELENANPPLD